MAKTRTRKRGSGKFLTGLIAFLLGFIMAFVVEIGVIVGGGYYVLNYVNIDTLFSAAGQPNRDENNKPIYINTDAYATIMALINEIAGLASTDWDDMPIGTIIEMSPILEERLVELCKMCADNYGVYIDVDDLKQQTGGTLQSYFMDDVIREIRPYEVVVKTSADQGNDIADNPFLVTILDGQEVSTVDVNGERCIVYYDEYIEGADGNYYRVVDNAGSDQALPSYLAADAEKWLVQTNSVWKDDLATALPVAEGSFVYRQYYYYNPATQEYTATTRSTQTDSDGNEIYTFEYYDHASAAYPAEYGSDPQRYTGNYIINDSGEREYLTYTQTDSDGNETQKSLEITVGYIMDKNFDINTLYYVDLTDVLAEVMGTDPILDMLFNGITLGEMFSRGIEFSEQVDQFALADILKPTAEEDDVLLYLCYKIRNIDRNTLTAAYTYTYEDGREEERTAQIILGEDGVIDKVVDAQTGEELYKTRVRDINDLIEGLDISVLTGPVEISDNNIMAYIVYGITDIQPNADGTYSAIYHADGESFACTVYVNADDEITSVIRDSDGSPIRGATKDEIGDRLNGAMDVMPLADLVPVTPSHTGADGRTVNNNIMLFTIYSATMSPADSGDAFTDDVGTYYNGTYYDENGVAYKAHIYVKDGSVPVSEQRISHVVYSADGGATYTENGVKTSINGVEGQITRLTEVLTIGDIISIDPDDRLMSKLGGYTINNISDAINEIVVSDAVNIGPDEDIMLYVAFGITDVTDNGDGTYSAVYNGLDGTTQPVILQTQQAADGDGNPITIVVGIETADGQPVTDGGEVFNGTIMSEVGSRVQNITNDMSAVSFMGGVSPDSPIMMYIGYGVSGVGVDEDGAYTGTYTDENGYSYPCYIEVGTDGNVSSVYYIDGGTRTEISGVKVADLQGRIDDLTTTLTIGEIIGEENIDESDTILNLVKDSTIDELPDRINELTIGEIVGGDITEDDKILYLIKDSTVGNLQDTIDALTVQDMYSAEIYNHYYRVVAENPSSGEVLYNSHYTYYTRNDDGSYTSVGTIAQGEMDPDTTYYVHFDSEWLNVVGSSELINSASDIVFNPEYLYYTRTDNPDGTHTYELVNGDGRLTSLDVDHEYFTRGRATGVWYLLLYDDVDGQSVEVKYTVNELGDMMAEAVTNLTNATLWDFYQAGIIEEPSHNLVPIREYHDGDALDPGETHDYIYYNSVQISSTEYVLKQVADCTIDEIMNAVTILTNLIN